MNVVSTVFQSILLTILWAGFVFTGNAFIDGEPPKATVVPPEAVELGSEGESEALSESLVEAIIDSPGGSFMTEEALEQATEEYERNQWLLAGLSVLSGIGTFVFGLRLFEHWSYAVVTLALGPGIVAYYFLYKANRPSLPTPNLPPS